MALQIPDLDGEKSGDLYDLVVYAANLCQEAAEVRAPYLKLAQDNTAVYEYGERDPEGLLTINEAGNAVIVITDLQTKEPIRVILEGVESGEPGVIYWNGPAAVAEALQLDPRCVQFHPDETNNIKEPIPLQPEAEEQLQLVPGFKDEWIVSITDDFAAKVMQQYWDVMWKRSYMDQRIRSNLLSNNIHGWNDIMYAFDRQTMKHLIYELSPTQVYMDPIHAQSQDSTYIIVDWVVDPDEAKRAYPEIAKQIDDGAVVGTPYVMSGGVTYGALMISYRRPMVTMRIMWLRNQPIPMTADEAKSSGKKVPMLPEPEPPATEPETDSTNAPAAPPTSNPTTQASQPDLGHPDWPKRFGVRETVIIRNVVVLDRECPYKDIPVCHNVDVPIPLRPQGLGEPHRIAPMQEGRNSVVRNQITHTKQYAFPAAIQPQSVKDNLPEKWKDRGVEAGMTYTAPDHIYKDMAGNVITVIKPPEMPEGMFRLDSQLQQNINRLAGNTDVQQGYATGQVASGVAIGKLQEAGSSMAGFKSQSTAFMIEYLARLMLHSMTRHALLTDIIKIISRWPAHILNAAIKHGKSMDWDINIVVASGSAQIIQRKKQEAIEKWQLGLISTETCRERIGEDHVLEERRKANEQKQQLQQQQEIANATGVGNEPDGDEKRGNHPGNQPGKPTRSPGRARSGDGRGAEGGNPGGGNPAASAPGEGATPG